MKPSDLCATLRSGLSALFECSLAPQGAVRVRTPFMYPDGDLIDVYVEQRGEEYLVTDYGEALGWLRMHSFSERLTSNQCRMADDVCLTLGVELDRGQISLSYRDTAELGEAVHTLGQAAVRISDIWFTLRTRAIGSIGDEVEEWLQERSFRFERNRQHTGRSGRMWRVDFQVVAEAKKSLVFLLSTGTQAWARRMSERVVAGCTDLIHLAHQPPGTAFVSLFDDTIDVWRDEDFALVQRFSSIATWSKPDEFEAILTTEWAAPSPLLTSR